MASLLHPGDHVVAVDDLYGGTYRYFEQVVRPRGVAFSYVDGRDTERFEAALTSNTRLVWIETPTNPLLHLVDIDGVSRLTRARGIPLAVDNTFATSFLQKPLALGADIVVYSTTKYVSGHSDVVGGAVVTSSAELHDRIKFHQNAAGAVPGPFDAWLTLRGVRTLAVRMARHEQNAAAIARFLHGHAGVRAVHYPGLPEHPQHALAARQMAGFGGMVTFDLAGGLRRADAFVRALRLFSFAESLGGVESLACHPATMTHAAIPAAERERRGITEGTLRLSVGIEDIDDLRADLEQALHAAATAAA